MLNYLKDTLGEMTKNNSDSNNDIPPSAILEYTSLFQELDDLTAEGEPVTGGRPSIDIPLDDSIEVDSVEIDLNDGRVVDIPSDAAVQESMKLKTFDDFYQEACNTIQPHSHRMSDDVLEKRRYNHAGKLFTEYTNQMKVNGVGGFQNMNVLEDSVPSAVTIDFGEIKSGLPVSWEMESSGIISKKQVDTLAVCEQYMGGLFTKVIQHLDSDDTNPWGKYRPVGLCIPKNPTGKNFKAQIVVESFDTCDLSTYTVDINPELVQESNNFTDVRSHGNGLVCSKEHGRPPSAKTKNDYKKISMNISRPSRFGKTFQEGIDFGDGDDTQSGGDTGGDSQPQQPAGDTNNTGDNIDMSTGGTDQQPAPDANATANPDAEKIENNDVSDQIVQNVADAKDSDDGDMNMSGDSDNIEFNTNDSNTEGDAEAKLEDLDKTAGDEMDLEEGDPTDVNNMTINQLLDAGEKRLKNMTTVELQSFIGSVGVDDVMPASEEKLEYATSIMNDIVSESVEEMFDCSKHDVIQEFVFLNQRNIKIKIKEHLRKFLGVLNDSEMNLSQIFAGLKKEGKILNRIFTKASKMKTVFSSEDTQTFTSINKILVDLMSVVNVKNKPTDSEAQTIKTLIRSFVDHSKLVDKIINGEPQSAEGEE